MWHNKKHKYKEFEGMDNIIVEDAELPVNQHGTGWILPTGAIIFDRQDAINYATKLNHLIQHNKHKRKIKGGKFQ